MRLPLAILCQQKEERVYHSTPVTDNAAWAAKTKVWLEHYSVLLVVRLESLNRSLAP